MTICDYTALYDNTAKIVSVSNNDIVFQLEDFLARLADSGFSVGLDTYIESLKILQWLNTNENLTKIDSQVLSSYFSPVICKSDEEQDRFANLFNTFFLNPLEQLQDKRRKEKKKKRKKVTKKIIEFTSAILLLLSALWFYHISNIEPVLNYSGLASEKFFVHKGQNESLTTQTVFGDKEDTFDFKLQNKFFDDGSVSNGIHVYHTFKKYGFDSMEVFIRSKKFGLDTIVRSRNIEVGPEKNPEINSEKTSVREGEENMFTVDVDTNYRTSYYWKISSGDSILKTDSNRNQLTYRFSRAGDYIIQFWYDTLSDTFLSKFPDEFKSVSLVQKVSSGGLQLGVDQKSLPYTLTIRINIWWIIVLIGLLLFFVFVAIKSWKKRNATKIGPPAGVLPAQAEKPPYDIPMLPKEHNINSDYKLLSLSNELRKRVESNVEELNLKKTIEASIANVGFLTPQYDKRPVNREYLFLIDQAYYNSQQVRLFEYLVNLFKNRSVTLDFYFYNQTPEKFYAKAGGQKQALNYIKNRHYNASLIIIANGQNFIDIREPVIKRSIVNSFVYWQTRILVTPIPFNDWGGNEKLLSDFFILVPADIQGLLQLVKLINEGENKVPLFSQHAFFAYESKYIDFNDVESLREYLNDEELFQWLCATAVYSKIKWEVFLEIGKVLLKDKSRINYSTLLKFVRIKWMQEGSFPATTRLVLLKELTVENELKARETMLHLINEIQVKDDSYSSSEKLLNLYANSFVLYASGKEQYRKKDIEENAEKFISLYSSNRLLDMPLKIYIEKKETGNVGWETPITFGNKNVGIAEYIEEKKEAKKNEVHRKKRKYLFQALGAVISVIGLISFLFYLNAAKGKMIQSKINKVLHLADNLRTADERTIVRIIPNDCIMQLLSNLKDSLLYFQASVTGQQFLDSSTKRLIDSSFKLNFRLKSPISGYDTNSQNVRDSMETTFDTVSLLVPLKKNYISGTQIIYFLRINNQLFHTQSNAGYGIYDLELLGCPNPTKKITVDYYPGYDDDTAKITKDATRFRDSMNIYIHQMATDHTHANYIIFGEGIDSATKYEVTSVLVNAGFPLKHIYNKTSYDNRNKIEINGIDSLEKKPLISQDSLRCRYLNACKGKQQLIQIIYNNADSGTELNRLASCISSNKISTALSVKASSGFPKNVIRYYRGSFVDSLKFLQNCLKSYFTDRTFVIEKTTSQLSQNAAGQIYVYYESPPAVKPAISILISDKSLLESTAAFRKELLTRGFNVGSVQISSAINNNSFIMYYDNQMAKQADIIKTIYRNYYPDLPINATLSSKNSGNQFQRDVSNNILIWIRKYEPKVAPVYKSWIENVKYPLSAGTRDTFNVAFDVMVSLPMQAQTKQINPVVTLGETIQGKICVYSDAGNCANFSIPGANGRVHVSRLVDIGGKAVGTHELRVVINDLKIDTSIGTFTILLQQSSARTVCDTMDNMHFPNTATIPILATKISLKWMKQNTGSAKFLISKLGTSCPLDSVLMNVGEPKSILLCDGSTLKLTLIGWENETKADASGEKAIINATLCKPISVKNNYNH